jgi:ribosome-associated translation inhibitor RaiA
MLTLKEKVERLEMAVALLNDADAMMQAALGASDECYEMHCAIENVADDITDMMVALKDKVNA